MELKLTDQSLIEQMKITSFEIAQRKQLLSLTHADLILLSSHKLMVEANIDDIVTEFYENQIQNDEISLLIGDADTLQRLQSAQRKYILDLFSGTYDDEYVNNRLRIGLVHKRIGVDPKLYLASVRQLKAVVTEVLSAFITDFDQLTATLVALEKLFYFDITLVFDTYIDTMVNEIKIAQKKTEDYATSLERVVAERTQELKEQAQLDPLTNIYNHRALHEFLGRELALSQRKKTSVSLVYFDIDHFKQINDTCGHVVGDEVLKHLSLCMLGSIRVVDYACRYGGDEFCVLLPDCALEHAKGVCQKIIDKFVNKYPDYSISMGIAESTDELKLEPEELVQQADTQMYLAKKELGCQVCA